MSKDADMMEGQEVLRVTVTLACWRSRGRRGAQNGTLVVLKYHCTICTNVWSEGCRGTLMGASNDSGFWGLVGASTLEELDIQIGSSNPSAGSSAP